MKAGTINQLSSWIGSNVAAPLIPALAASTGLNPEALFAATVIGSQSSAISPFSSGGSLIMAS